MDQAIDKAGGFNLGDRNVGRLGYGAMQLAGSGVLGPPNDPPGATAVLREAIASGVNHIDTSDFYGPHLVNRLLRDALSPYPADLVLVTKVGAARGSDGSWIDAVEPPDLIAAVHDNIRNLGVDTLDVVNLRVPGLQGPREGSIARQFETLAELQRNGLIRHLGLSNVTAAQISEARAITSVVCVQNHYNIVQRADDALIDHLASMGIAYVPFFPLGGFNPIQSSELSAIAAELDATPRQIGLAWLLQRAPNILLIPGTSSIEHLRENLAARSLLLSEDSVDRLNLIGLSA